MVPKSLSTLIKFHRKFWRRTLMTQKDPCDMSSVTSDKVQNAKIRYGDMTTVYDTIKCFWVISKRHHRISELNPRRPLDLRATRQPLVGGACSCPLYFCDHIVARRRYREAKLCTRLPEYLAKVVFKFGVNHIWNDVTVTSEVKL